MTGGLAGSALVAAVDRPLRVALLAGLALALLAIARPRSSLGAPGRFAWLALIAASAAIGGLGIGWARLEAIDAGTLRLEPGQQATVRGYVTAVPDRSAGEVRVRLQTPAGRLLVEAPEPVPDLAVGGLVRVRGKAREPSDWEAGWLQRLGIATIVAADSVEPLPGARRGGLSGVLDGFRARAESALGQGTSPQAASLLRGFVLGQDDRIEATTVQQFKRSGLAHLLAVSGQNVVLLAVLATTVLAALAVPLRARLAWILVAIAVYVPVAGAGASIQRAGVMGAAGVIAALAGRPASRWYALLLAACATLALDPRASADVGWQLSFAAVVGILLAARPISTALAARARGWRRALADGLALTLAATLATGPLMAHHFGTISIAALPANALALPAVAPVMWLGMLSAVAGQIGWVPIEPLTWLAGLLAAYIAQIAAWLGNPVWSQAGVRLAAPLPLLASYGLLAGAFALALRFATRHRALRPAIARRAGGSWRGPAVAALAAAALAAATGIAAPRAEPGPPSGLRLTMLDVGQGDAILIEPPGGAPILVDAGPAAADVAGQLARHGTERLAALAITHPESDHDGGALDVLGRFPTERLLFARAAPETLAAARLAGTTPVRVAAGDELRAGALRLSVLWPPAERLRPGPAGRPDDPNLLSLILELRWHRFEALLTGDAEAEAAPVDPGPVDVLKVAHHGSADAGLERLLELSEPGLALISVGKDNPFGHPSSQALDALAAQGVEVLRTDRDGEIRVDVDRTGWWVSG